MVKTVAPQDLQWLGFLSSLLPSSASSSHATMWLQQPTHPSHTWSAAIGRSLSPNPPLTYFLCSVTKSCDMHQSKPVIEKEMELPSLLSPAVPKCVSISQSPRSFKNAKAQATPLSTKITLLGVGPRHQHFRKLPGDSMQAA